MAEETFKNKTDDDFNEEHDLVSEDLETEVINITAGIVIDSDDSDQFIDEMEKLFEKYAYPNASGFHFTFTNF